MKFIGQLDMGNKKESDILDTVLEKVSSSTIVVILKQAVKNGEDAEGNPTYEGVDRQIAVVDTGAMIRMDGTLLYATIRDLKRDNVKEIQNLWKTVLQRGKEQFLKNEENDYYLTFDCVYNDEARKKTYTFGAFHTPLFCSSDGDEDLTMTFFTEECYIDVSRYDKKETEYLAAKLVEEGKIVTNLMNKLDDGGEPVKKEQDVPVDTSYKFNDHIIN